MPADTSAVLTPEQVKDFQARLKEAILVADKAIYDTKSQLPTLMNTLDSVTEDILTGGYLKETKQNILRLYNSTIENWELWKKSLWGIVGTGTIEGRPITKDAAEKLIQSVAKAIKGAKDAIGLVNQYAKGTILTGAIGKVFGDAAAVLSAAFDAVMALAKGAAKTVKTAGDVLGWLPWIIGGVIVIPLLLRTFSAYKRGGSAAAADEAAGQIERGRSRAADAVSSGARKLLTRGVAGAPRRRRRKG